MTRPRILITRAWPAPAEAALSARFDVTLRRREDGPMSAPELAGALRSFDALGVTVTDRVDAAALEGARVRMLANFGVGVSHIDLDACRAAGIALSNTPGVLTDCTADLAMGLLIAAARRMGAGERQVRAGEWTGWRPDHLMGAKVSGACLGIIGFGRIGRAMARRAAHGFGMRVVFFNRSAIDPAIAGACGAEQRASIEEVLELADFVSLHCPGGEENRHLIDAARLARMKPSAMLINTARGEVVDEAALAEALASNVIAGAGLDVFAREPEVHRALTTLENVVLLPHLGSATHATREAMGMSCVANLAAFFDGRALPNRVL